MIFKALFKFDFKRVIALIVAFFQLIGLVIFDTPVTPYKNEIDMSKFELRWEDNFDKGFDTKYWQGHYVYGANDTQPRDTAMWNRGQVSFTEDGCLLSLPNTKRTARRVQATIPTEWKPIPTNAMKRATRVTSSFTATLKSAVFCPRVQA